VLVGEAGVALERAAFARALALGEQAVQADPEDAAGFEIAGVAAARLGMADKAEALFDEVARRQPDNPTARRNLASAGYLSGNPGRARQAVRRLAALGAAGARDYLQLGVLEERIGAWPAARDAYARALASDPASVAARLGMGNAARHDGQLEAAREHYERACDLAPGSPEPLIRLANVLLESDAVPVAIESYRRAIRYGGGEAAWYGLGIALRATGDDPGAANAFENALEVAPNALRTRLNLVRVLQDLGREASAREHLHPALAGVRELHPDMREKVLGRILDIELEAGQTGKALRICESYLAEFPGDTGLTALHAICLNEAGETGRRDALMDYDRVVRVVSVDPPVGWSSLEAFDDALVAELRAHPSLGYAPPDHATRYGEHSGNLFEAPGPAISALRSVIQREARDFCTVLPAAVRGPSPDGAEYYLWGVIMHREGHQLPHIHPGAWVSGCYYARVPGSVRDDDPGQGGWIEFGRTPDDYHVRVPMPVIAHRPRPGMLALFPSYLYHRTISLAGEEPRVSLAFDMVPGSFKRESD